MFKFLKNLFKNTACECETYCGAYNRHPQSLSVKNCDTVVARISKMTPPPIIKTKSRPKFNNTECQCVGKNCGAGGPPGQNSYSLCETASIKIGNLPKPIPDPPKR